MYKIIEFFINAEQLKLVNSHAECMMAFFCLAELMDQRKLPCKGGNSYDVQKLDSSSYPVLLGSFHWQWGKSSPTGSSACETKHRNPSKSSDQGSNGDLGCIVNRAAMALKNQSNEPWRDREDEPAAGETGWTAQAVKLKTDWHSNSRYPKSR